MPPQQSPTHKSLRNDPSAMPRGNGFALQVSDGRTETPQTHVSFDLNKSIESKCKLAAQYPSKQRLCVTMESKCKLAAPSVYLARVEQPVYRAAVP